MKVNKKLIYFLNFLKRLEKYKRKYLIYIRTKNIYLKKSIVSYLIYISNIKY